VTLNARDVVEMFEPELASARTRATQLTSAISPMFGEAKRVFANADPETRVVAGLAAGLVLGRVVNRLGR
jgi:hypothetical protein